MIRPDRVFRVTKTKALVTVLACCLLLVPALSLTGTSRGEVVSWCRADIGGEKIIAITGGGVMDETGMRYGDTLKIFDIGALDGIRRGRTDAEPLFTEELTDIKPLKVMAGDVTGDGVQEISVMVYKTALFHPVPAKRPFFYGYNGELFPVWRGSRLSRPFDDYELYDIDGNGADEIIAIERLQNNDSIVCAYAWRGFGFEELARSDAFTDELRFVSPSAIRSGRKTLKLRLAGDSGQPEPVIVCE